MYIPAFIAERTYDVPEQVAGAWILKLTLYIELTNFQLSSMHQYD